MRVLCDVHIPYRLVNFLRERGVDATHVNRILDKGLRVFNLHHDPDL
jgi:predicted nuclease of predicted toxin-antitoxin system